MSNTELTRRLKELRKRKGFSQEELAETTGLSLRTIQRIENGETEPRSDSLKRLADAFNIQAEEITDWTIQEDKGFLMSLNLSGLISLVFPVLAIIVTLMMWTGKRDKVKGAKALGRKLINFQITCTILFFMITVVLTFIKMIAAFDEVAQGGTSNPDLIATSITSALYLSLIAIVIFNIYAFAVIIINALRIKKDKEVRYFPAFAFMKS